MADKLTRAIQVVPEALLREWAEERFSSYPIEEMPGTELTRLLRPSVRAKEPSEIHPRLRNDALFFPLRDGVMLRSDQQSFFLYGDSVYPMLNALAPLLSGEHSLQEICADLEPRSRESLIELINVLLEGGILKDQAQEKSLLRDDIRRRFKDQIEFIAHLANDPLHRFEEFRQSRLLLIGSGSSFARCAASLVGYGLKDLFALPTGADPQDLNGARSVASGLESEGIDASVRLVGRFEPDSRLLDLKKLSILVYCTDSPSLTDLQLISRWSDESCVRVLPGFVLGNQAIMGPAMEPEAGGCWVCGLFRIVDDLGNQDRRTLFRKHLFSTMPVQLAPSDVMARMLGDDIAFEAFKILIGKLRTQTQQNMLIQWAEGEGSIGATIVPNSLTACIGDCNRFVQTVGRL